MVRIIIALLFWFPAVAFAQTYPCNCRGEPLNGLKKTVFPKAEELGFQALKLEPKKRKECITLFQLGIGSAPFGRV